MFWAVVTEEEEAMKGIVAVVDALGVSTLDLGQSQRFVRARDEIISQIGKVSKATSKFLSDKDFTPHFNTIGDTIVISWEASKDESDLIHGLIWTGTWLRFLVVLGLHHDLLFRGAMSYGHYISEKNTILGPAVADAASWYGVADWFGIVCVPSMQFLINRIELFEEDEEECVLPSAFIKYDVPVKPNGSKSLWTVPWPFDIWYRCKRESKNDLEARRASQGSINKLLGNFSIPIGTEDKYSNALKYFEHCVSTFATGKKITDTDVHDYFSSLKLNEPE